MLSLPLSALNFRTIKSGWDSIIVLGIRRVIVAFWIVSPMTLPNNILHAAHDVVVYMTEFQKPINGKTTAEA